MDRRQPLDYEMEVESKRQNLVRKPLVARKPYDVILDETVTDCDRLESGDSSTQ